MEPTQKKSFFKKRIHGWMLRHQLAFNFWIHMIGIPISVIGLILFLGRLLDTNTVPLAWSGGGFVLGYVLQWIGHKVEGNDLGEWAAIKKLLGLPFVGIAPRWNHENPNQL
ncbi:MAG: DUF962 domain-containing protein [Planctomycetota bacterium]|nr:DUF962 domain-containing protein [Planctomycetota bacterium]